MTCKPFTLKDFKEADSFLRKLNASNDVCLQNLRFALKQQPHLFQHCVGRLEACLLAPLNTTETSCALRSSIHPHYSCSKTSKTSNHMLLVECFSLIPRVLGLSKKGEKFSDFISRILLSVCDCAHALFDIYNLPLTISSVHSYLSSKVNTFSSLSPIQKDDMPHQEYVDLLHERIDFFTRVLRSALQTPCDMPVYIPLPLITAFFTAVMSVEFSNSNRITAACLKWISQLIHCLALVVRSYGSKLAPVSATFLTLLVYNLDWTTNWRKTDSNLHDGLVRIRLAALRCLCDFIACCSTFCFNRLMNLFPRIVDHIVQDFVYISNIPAESVNLNEASGKESGDITVNTHMLQILMGSLTLINVISCQPLFSFISNRFNLLNSAVCESEFKEAIARLQFMFVQLVDKIVQEADTIRQSHKHPFRNPEILSRTVETLSSLSVVCNSFTLQTSLFTLLGFLVKHTKPELRAFAIKLLSTLRLTKNHELVRQDTKTQQIVNKHRPLLTHSPLDVVELAPASDVSEPQSKCYSNAIQSDPEASSIQMQPETITNINPAESSILESSDEPNCKRRCTIPECKIVMETDAGNSEASTAKESIQTCLSSFDPTFL